MKPLSAARDLQRRRGRERTGLFTAEGVRCVEELLASPLRIQSVIVAPGLRQTERGAALSTALADAATERGYVISESTDAALLSAAGTDTPQGIIAIAEQPERSFEDIHEKGTVLVLDAVQDPGNVGTILRTARAFGVSATIALAGTADLWNPKVVRAAMGALFSHLAFSASSEQTLKYLETNLIPLWATSATGEPIACGSGGGAVAIVVGNEASGISPSLAGLAERTVSVPIHGVESLNVAVATGIILFALTTA